jgi:hypothetical protein
MDLFALAEHIALYAKLQADNGFPIYADPIRHMLEDAARKAAPPDVAGTSPSELGKRMLADVASIPWVKLGELREGALFETREGIRAVKSEYHYGNDPGSQCQCVLLESGEYAHFGNKNNEMVREIILT